MSRSLIVSETDLYAIAEIYHFVFNIVIEKCAIVVLCILHVRLSGSARPVRLPVCLTRINILKLLVINIRYTGLKHHIWYLK